MSKKTDTRDLVILGAGPGGYPAAFRAAELGLDVTLVDPRPNPGGVCLFCGCIPSKALLHVVGFLRDTERAEHWGVHIDGVSVDPKGVRDFKNEVVERLTGGLGQLCKQRKVEHLRATGKFTGSDSRESFLRRFLNFEEGDPYELAYEQAIVATGSDPIMLPGTEEMDRVMESTEALETDEVPERLLVIGAGYIGIELGQVYAALGSQVTVVEMLSEILPSSDRDLAKVLRKRVDKEFEAILLETKVSEIREEQDKVRVRLEGKHGSDEEQVFDKAMIAIGRSPVSEGLGLETADVETNEKGFITVDGQRRTTNPKIFAIGDVVGQPMLAHKATQEGRVAAEVAAGQNSTFAPKAIPKVIFSNPEIAYTGLTEQAAEEQGVEVEIRRFPWMASGRAVTIDRTDGLTKLVLEPGTGRILGAGIAGVNAGELIGQATQAIELGAVAEDLALIIHTHPTLSETLMEAAEAFLGESTHYGGGK